MRMGLNLMLRSEVFGPTDEQHFVPRFSLSHQHYEIETQKKLSLEESKTRISNGAKTTKFQLQFFSGER